MVRFTTNRRARAQSFEPNGACYDSEGDCVDKVTDAISGALAKPGYLHMPGLGEFHNGEAANKVDISQMECEIRNAF